MASQKNIAIDLGAQSIGVGVFGSGPKKTLILEKIASSDLLADPAADATRLDASKEAIGGLVKSLKLKGQEVQYAVSSQSVFTRFVKLPPLDVDQLDQIVGFEAQQQVPFPIEDAVWDYQTLGDPDDIEVEVVLVAIKADELDAINSAVRANNIETSKVDLAPMALYNAFRYNYPDIQDPVVLIDIGGRTTNLIYVESNKVFIRSINTGGRDVSQTIAKEFGISFEEAEARKLKDGFVALGGAYADHDDPEIAAMSKVIRNALTRLHSEIIRTNNFYRSSQGGSAPVAAFLCGAGAGLPYINEFFQEKLKVPVEYFNALRNVQLGRKIDEVAVTAKAHALGELVGLGLRGMGETPMEIDLVPRLIQRERSVARRAPFYWLAGLSTVALLGSLGLFYQKSSSFAEQKSGELQAKVEVLEDYSAKIDEQMERLEMIRGRSNPYSSAVLNRVYWITSFRELSQAFVDDMIWFVELQPMAGDKLLIAEPQGEEFVGEFDPSMAESGQYMIDSLQLKGLWRDNQTGGSKVVYKYLDRLRDSKRWYFDLVERDENGSVITNADGSPEKKFTDGELLNPINHGTGANRHAWDFTLRLPLPEGRQIQFTK